MFRLEGGGLTFNIDTSYLNEKGKFRTFYSKEGQQEPILKKINENEPKNCFAGEWIALSSHPSTLQDVSFYRPFYFF